MSEVVVPGMPTAKTDCQIGTAVMDIFQAFQQIGKVPRSFAFMYSPIDPFIESPCLTAKTIYAAVFQPVNVCQIEFVKAENELHSALPASVGNVLP